MSKQAITITDTEVHIRAEYFCRRDNTCAHKDILADIFTKQYRDQGIRITANDGENLIATGLLTLVYEFCEILDISVEKVTVETHDTNLHAPFIFKHLAPGIFLNTGNLIPKFTHCLDNPKFAGLVVGRFTVDRLRLAYELDQAFPNDNYMIFQGRLWSDMNSFTELYQKEIDWFTNKQFDLDVKTKSPVGAVGFDDACINYPKVWNRFEIEIVAETDAVSSFWFTEKTAKCLATGKPFLLLNGHASLEKLKGIGFETFNSVIDESYDQKYLPTQRIESIVNSLKELYNSSNKSEKINEMYEIAKRNQMHYNQYVNSQRYNVQS